jgi:hypothetical protein
VDRADISGNLTDFSSTNAALHADKGTEVGYESHDDLTLHCGNPTVTKNTAFHRVYLTWNYPRRWIEVVFQVI